MKPTRQCKRREQLKIVSGNCLSTPTDENRGKNRGNQGISNGSTKSQQPSGTLCFPRKGIATQVCLNSETKQHESGNLVKILEQFCKTKNAEEVPKAREKREN